MLNDKSITNIRSGEFFLHCTKVKIYQKVETGVQLSGHGTIKINPTGCLYLEFICTGNENLPNTLFNKKIPEDALIEDQALHLEVESLDGSKYISSGFSIVINGNIQQVASCMHIWLSSISNVSYPRYRSEEKSALYFEFSEICDVPTNKSNTDTSTLGYESTSRNETVFDIDKIAISMVKKDGYVTANVLGDFKLDKVLETLLFYIGFSGGVMPQPYITKKRSGDELTTTIYSINNSYKHMRSSNPMVSAVAEDEYLNSHYQLFSSMLNLNLTKPKTYKSIYSQWNQVWHAFQSENAITSLTLSVAIEGVLNDIFIPAIKKNEKNPELDIEIKRIKALLSGLTMSDKHMETLKNSISFSKKVTAAKALTYLMDKEVITLEEKNLWSTLRNECAHPEVRSTSLAAQSDDRDRVLSCLNLFHNLVFNVLKYSGPRHYFKIGSKSNTAQLIEHKEVISIKL